MKTITFKLSNDEEKFYKKVIASSRYKHLKYAKEVYMDIIIRALAQL